MNHHRSISAVCCALWFFDSANVTAATSPLCCWSAGSWESAWRSCWAASLSWAPPTALCWGRASTTLVWCTPRANVVLSSGSGRQLSSTTVSFVCFHDSFFPSAHTCTISHCFHSFYCHWLFISTCYLTANPNIHIQTQDIWTAWQKLWRKLTLGKIWKISFVAFVLFMIHECDVVCASIIEAQCFKMKNVSWTGFSTHLEKKKFCS